MEIDGKFLQLTPGEQRLKWLARRHYAFLKITGLLGNVSALAEDHGAHIMFSDRRKTLVCIQEMDVE